jgi:protein-S-isoprenylcysteine O-methyltransferase Ste14
MDIYTSAYFAALLIEIVIRTPIDRKRRLQKKTDQRISGREMFSLTLLLLGGVILPVLYAATGWLDFADYRLPAWAGWLGVALAAAGVFVFWRAHVDLGLNWSPSLEIRERHELITHGIYGVIRHPMYTSQLLLSFAQPLLVQNWIAGWAGPAVFLVFYFLRVGPEEQMMLDTFGDQYREYMKKVGGVLPRVRGA